MKNSSTRQEHSPGSAILPVIVAISAAHFLNDLMQSMLPAIYPLLRNQYHLSFLQIGLITAVYQITGSFLQPFIGLYTDKRPLPYSLPYSSFFTMLGLLILAFSPSYLMLLLGASIVGLGSSIFHPEGSRVARLAAGERCGFAQSIFQLGGNAGTALGPLVAALIIMQQSRISWLTPFCFAGIILLYYLSKWYATLLKSADAKPAASVAYNLNPKQVNGAFAVLIGLMFAKYIYLACMQNYYTFYMIEKFHVNPSQAQFFLFIFLLGMALGTIAGGPLADRIGTRAVIWLSILGIFPFTSILPFVGFYSTLALTFIIGLILASAFPAIVVFAQELVPGRVGTVSGALFGLSFGIAGLGSSVLGLITDKVGLHNLFIICSFLPVLGLIAVFLPPTKSRIHIEK